MGWLVFGIDVDGGDVGVMAYLHEYKSEIETRARKNIFYLNGLHAISNNEIGFQRLARRIDWNESGVSCWKERMKRNRAIAQMQ